MENYFHQVFAQILVGLRTTVRPQDIRRAIAYFFSHTLIILDVEGLGWGNSSPSQFQTSSIGGGYHCITCKPPPYKQISQENKFKAPNLLRLKIGKSKTRLFHEVKK